MTRLCNSKCFRFGAVTFTIVSLVLFCGATAKAQEKTTTDKAEKSKTVAVEKASSNQNQDPNYLVQGEYAGSLSADAGGIGMGVQVVALGSSKFDVSVYFGGLPGDGWNGDAPLRQQEVELKEGELVISSERGSVVIVDGAATIFDPSGNDLGSLDRVVRKSATLGAKPPEGALVLFDGTSVEAWQKKNGKPAQMTKDGLLKQGVASKQRFKDLRIHVEFLLPFMPEARGQKRGNSGIYVQGLYEVQMLDSFGLAGEHNECGGIYKLHKPKVNMCFPPMQWQTYDIEFHAAEFEGDNKTKDAWMTVKHNGVLIHDKVKLAKRTQAAPLTNLKDPGYIFLQDHGNEVRYRNIWVKKLD